MTKLTNVIAFAFINCVAQLAPGAVGQENGSAAGYWDTHCVVVCKIVEVGFKKDSGTSARVDVLGVASTSFVVPTSTLNVEFATVESSMTLDDVVVGTTVCACIWRVRDRWAFPCDVVTFMLTDSGAPIQRVTGIDDPKGAEKGVRSLLCSGVLGYAIYAWLGDFVSHPAASRITS